ncbi:response regulator transcription factor [Novilysobacter avium]|uniref:Response regulator transcription factor n=1 Tax=Novilysobacter avium TaxID=2781023 RepID=A0A7S6ZU54_9GAMM|nr:response regulator transcription factor [Lysobacter avium]QOW21710.1 response regulator transcription factor [Lysobacter avium]
MALGDGPWVMVVEDDNELREVILAPVLANAGFNVATAPSALEMYRAMVGREFDFFVLDVGLPDEDGFSIVTHLRGLTRAGLVLLTGRASSSDKVRGLDGGADAYLTKPVDPTVLVATLRSIGRRAASDGARPADIESKQHADGWTFDLDRWRLLAPGGGTVKLSVAERELLALLVGAAGEVVPRKRILDSLASKIAGFEEERLEMLIFRLRRKANTAAAGRELPIHTVRGVGYVLAS